MTSVPIRIRSVLSRYYACPMKNMSEDEDASLTKLWCKKLVRELLYDAEDHLDEVSNARAGSDFSELLARVEDASKRCKLFSKAEITAGVSRPKLPVPLGIHVVDAGGGRSTVGATHMVPPNKLVELLALDNDKKILKVIPIHGCAGVGKTTIARTLYHKHGWKFQCRAFVSVSQNPNMRAFLSSMLSQLKAPGVHKFSNVPDLINSISKHLEGKRYFIVIDDLWTASVWNLISCAFPRGDYCSRIITTTQIDDVALACCSYDSDYVYKMEPLNDHESRKIFFGILFGSEDRCPTNMEDVSYEIIRKCGGLPIAIVNIASLLASESNIVRAKLEHLKDALPSTFEGTADNLKLMYNSLPQLIYNCLPPRLRTCLLYLSIFPRGYVIKKDDLVNQWVAEGFLSALGGRDTEEIAEGYFDELVSRGIIQAVETNNNGDVLSCTVHQMVLDFIRHKSMEDNFIITVDYCESTLALPDKVRRLSVQFGGVKSAYIPESIITSHVRSLMFQVFFKCLPHPITDYGLLQVLILHIWADQENESVDLTMIHKLFRLKYIKIECNITVDLPDKIQMLQDLRTLQVDARLSAVPSDIVNLQRLLHLRLPSECFPPNGVANMTSLRTLGYFDLSSHSEEDVLHLERLTNLQDLQLTCSTVHPTAENLKKNVQLLGSILQKLSVLQSLTLLPASGSSCAESIIIPYDGFSIVSPPSDLLLRRIELSRRCCIFFTLPEWFGELGKLCILKIAIRHLWKEDVDILKGLPSLTSLTLYIQTVPADKIFIDKGGFQVLTYFKFMCDEPCLSFVQGAMPNVQKLNLGFNANKRRSHTFGTVGFCHLAGLLEIFVKLGARDDGVKFSIQAAETALNVAVKYHPNTIILRVQRVGVIFDGDEDQSTATELKEIAHKKILLEIREGKKKSGEGSSEEKEGTGLEMQNEIEEDKKKNTEHVEQYVSKQADSRYPRREEIFAPLTHHPQSIDLLTGAIGPLLPKLIEISLEKYNLETSVRCRAMYLHGELMHMKTYLLEVLEPEPQQLDEEFNVWARDVRDLSYNTEDVVDSFFVCVQGSQGGTMWHSWVGKFLCNLKGHHEIAYGINFIIKQADDVMVRLRHIDSRGINHIVPKPSVASFKYHLPNLYTYTKELVGIKVSTDEVIRKLIDGTNYELKIVSILGIGGLAKTTLAKSVYDRVQMQFNCRVFVSVSSESDMKKVLMDILLQIDKQTYMIFCRATLDTMQLIGVIRGILENKRYLIIVDDIWDVASWEIINCVLVDSRLGSRVVTTTRSYNVAEKAGGVYMLNALSPEDSKKSFSSTAFGVKEFLSDLPEFVSMLEQKCGGVPLAIIAVASLLAHKREIDWYTMKGIMKGIIRGGTDKMNTSDILAHIIHNLPYHLRACLLHLHIFPVGYLIKKETLIWKWAAEGFIVQEEGRGLFELGEAYFKELVNKNLVMPVEDDSYSRIVIGCRVHDLVLDVICALSIEENFVMVQGDHKEKKPSGRGARRLAVHKWAAETGNPLKNCRPKRLRSFNTMGCHFSTNLPSLSRFNLLRVVSIEECTLFEGSKRSNLTHLGKLLLLRYLGLYKTPIDNLPEEIGDLVSLQTLDLRGTTVKTLPYRVAQLRHLKCLRADEGTAVPDWMGNLTSLEELRLGQVCNSLNFVNELGKLTELRELEISAEQLDGNKEKALVQSMINLKSMQVLRIMGVSSSGDESNWEGYEPPLQLCELHITNTFSRLPAWINASRVPMLSCLHVSVKALEEEDLENIGSLPELVSLKLLMPSNVFPTIMGGGAFPSLRYFGTSAEVRFLPKAMPRLECFRFKVDAQALLTGDFDISTFWNLPLLQKVEVEISFSSDPVVKAVYKALEHVVDKHPNSPILDVIKADQDEITC